MSAPNIIERTDALLKTLGLDAILASSRQNIRHLGSVSFPHLTAVVPDERVFVVWGSGGRRKMLIPFWCKQMAKGIASLPLVEWGIDDEAIPALGSLVKSLGLEKGRIGYEAKNMVVSVRDRIMRELPGIELVPIDEELTLNRAIKTADEVALMRAASKAGELALAQTIAEGSIGMTQRELHAALGRNLLLNGADEISWVATCWNDSSEVGIPTDRPIEAGQFFHIEMGCAVDGYLTDLQRTVAVGSKVSEVDAVYQRLYAVHQRTMLGATPGLRLCDLHQRFMADMGENDLVMWDEYPLGHGLGTDVHERLFMISEDTGIISDGMVFAVEPVVLLPAGPHTPEGVRVGIEDIVAVTDAGNEILSAKLFDWSVLPRLGTSPKSLA